MIEAALVVIALLCLLGLAAMPAMWGWVGGTIVTAFFLAVSTVAGLGYHILLARALRGKLPRGWWWNPTRYHDDVPEPLRPRMMRWFYVGAACFGGCLLGLAMVITALIKSL